MKRFILILVLSVIALSFPSLAGADEVRMMIWHPQINTRDAETMGNIEIFIDYLNRRLTRDHITYSIVQTPEQAADYINQYSPAMGLIDRKYWRKYGRVLSSGRYWLKVYHLLKPSRPPNLFMGSVQIVPDVASKVLLKGARFESSGEKEEDFDLLGFMGLRPSKTLESSAPPPDETLLFGLFPRKSSDNISVVARFSTDIVEDDVIEDALLNMRSDHVGQETLDLLRINLFELPR